ncbi:hypothetical protein HK102_006479 [Quaeritorhiza haematococci]|nr:hypothetical protein HK102_006479 [Quaeritorhiza haematococci]
MWGRTLASSSPVTTTQKTATTTSPPTSSAPTSQPASRKTTIPKSESEAPKSQSTPQPTITTKSTAAAAPTSPATPTTAATPTPPSSTLPASSTSPSSTSTRPWGLPLDIPVSEISQDDQRRLRQMCKSLWLEIKDAKTQEPGGGVIPASMRENIAKYKALKAYLKGGGYKPPFLFFFGSFDCYFLYDIFGGLVSNGLGR